MVAAFEDAVTVFVLSHEYAHLLNGDIDSHPLQAEPATGANRHRAEILADGKALFITTATARTYGVRGSAFFGTALNVAPR